MTSKPDNSAYYVAHDQRFSYVRGLQAAYARLAEYLDTSADWIKANRRKGHAGLIKRVSATEARAAGL